MRDVGTLTLLSAGSVSGRVVDEHGAPVAGVQIGFTPYFSWYFEPVTRSDEHGAWTLRHLAPGTYTLWAGVDGWLWAERANVGIAAGVERAEVDFVLKRAAPIRGRCVEAHGAPLAGVLVYGRQLGPTNESFSCEATSETDGSFTLFPRRAGGCTLDVRAPDHVWRHPERTRVRAPGDAEIELTFAPVQALELLVIDAETRAPVETFVASGYVYDGDRMDTREVRERVHPGGIVQVVCTAPVGGFQIRADGFVAVGGCPEVGVPRERRTVELVRGAALRGRVLDDGVPIVGALIECGRVQAARDPSSSILDFEEGPDPPDDGTRPMIALEWFKATTNADGTFAVRGLVDGRYTLVIRPPKAMRFVARGYIVSNGRDLDVGDLRGAHGGTIRGRVVVNEGTPLDHVDIDVSGWSRSPAWFSPLGSAKPDASGAFRFEVPAGSMTVRAWARSAKGGASAMQEIVVRDNEITDVVLDLTKNERCELRVRVNCDGAPLTGAVVTFWKPGYRNGSTPLGVVPSDGLVSAHVEPDPAAEIDVKSSAGTRLDEPNEKYDLPVGGHLDVAFDLRVAPLTIVFPANMVLPKNGIVQVVLEAQCASGPCNVASFHAAISNDFVVAPRGTTWSDDFAWDVGLVVRREYRVHARILDAAASMEQRQHPLSFFGEVSAATNTRTHCSLSAIAQSAWRFW